MAARFTSPPDPYSFEQQVWDVVRQIPRGKVSTYGRIAEMIPPPGDMDPKSYQAFG
ncbi:MAG: MGMT family protein, partial [Anaerolineales bacterium]|nr:MGMT family protein [Anaerolineales bacterium]